MSIILGLNCYHADSSACIIINGKLKFGIEEERINRKKHWAGLPINSIKACLVNNNLKISDVTDIVINTNPYSNIKEKSIYFLKNYMKGNKKFEIFKRTKNKFNLLNDLSKNFKKSKLNRKVKLHFVDHHISHIASAFYPSKFKKAVGLSVDGFGDFCSVAIAKCESKKIQVIDRVYFPHSLGVFYEAFTQLLGFRNYGDEYKVMGLSSYGKPNFCDYLNDKFFVNKNKINLNLEYFNHIDKNFSYKFKGSPKQSKLLNKKFFSRLNLKNKSDFSKDKVDLACSVQKVFEQKLMLLIKKIEKINFSKNLVYAGGCALNSLANKKIYESKIFNKIFIPYAPGDGGGSIGAALIIANTKYNYKSIQNLSSPYIGPEYDNNEILEYIKKNEKLKKLKFKTFKNQKKLFNKIATSLYRNKIVGYFNGKMEFGARALGNRSILANPCNPRTKEILNKKIKRRENFRPFAPAILEENKFQWFNSKFDNPYMSSVELIIEKKRKLIPAVTHIDGTGRVQTVSKKTNFNFYSIIKKFHSLSGVPIILNTSFNENEPIVMDYKNAINCFLRTKMDLLVLNNILIHR